MATRNSNGEGTIYKRPGGRWCAKLQIGLDDKGKIIRKSFYGKTRKEVFAKLDEFRRLNEVEKNPDKSAVSQYILKWLSENKINELKPSSYDRLESTANTHIVPYIGSILLSELTSSHIQEHIINRMMNEDYSFSSIKKAYNAIDACLKFAVKSEHLSRNPCITVTLPSEHKFEKKELEVLSDEEISRLKTACLAEYSNKKPIYHLGNAIIFMLNTGLRMSEMLSLKWSDIDFENKTATISGGVVVAKERRAGQAAKRVVMDQETTKSKSGNRIIPLNGTALQALENLKGIIFHGEDSYICISNAGTITRPTTFSGSFDGILKTANIKHCGLHTLRHTFASKLFEKGVDVKTVSELLGHSDVSITYNTYIHLLKGHKAKSVKLLDEI